MVKSTEKILIMGTRTLSVEIADVISEIPGVEVCGFIENLHPEKSEEKLENLTIYWIDEINRLAESHKAISGLATTHRKRFVEQVAERGFSFATLLHPSARISKNSSIGEGTFVSSGVIIATHTHIGRHDIINRGVLIGHHTSIGDYVTINPGANIAGACNIGNGSFIGMGAIILDHLTVGSNSIIGAGSVVTKDVPDNVQVMGIPAKTVKENVEGK